MGFPWEEVLAGLGLPILVVLFLASPAIFGCLLGEVLRFFKLLFGKDEDE